MEDQRNINLYIYLFFQKDEEVFSILSQCFRPMVIALIQAQQIRPSDWAINHKDIFCLADTVLWKCLQRYRYDLDVTFSTFYRRVLNNELKDIYRVHSRHTLPSFVQSVSLDSTINDENIHYQSERLSSHPDPTHAKVVQRMENQRLLMTLNHELKPRQKEIIRLKLLGYRRQEICHILQISSQSVSYTLRKAKKKLSAIDED